MVWRTTYVFLRARPGNIYFFPNIPISFREQYGASKDVPGSTDYGGMLCHLWTVETSFRFWVMACLLRSNRGNYQGSSTVLKDSANTQHCKWSCDAKWKYGVLPKKKKDASELTNEMWSKKHWSGRKGKCVDDSTTRSATCTKIISDNGDSRRFPLPLSGKMHWKNYLYKWIQDCHESATLEWWTREHAWYFTSDGLHGLRNYSFVILTWWSGCWILLLMVAGYTRGYVFLIICTWKIGVGVLRNGRSDARK